MVIAWHEFAVVEGARRAEIQSAGRAASRAAFADAARAWVARFGPVPWEHAAIVHDAEGAPIIDAAGAPRMSVTHGHGLAGCAIAAPGQAWVGLDAERTRAPGMRAVRELAARTGEAALPWPDDDWPARLWCAKEAVVKAERSGADLLGRTLQAIEVLAVGARECPDLGAAAASHAMVRVRSHLGRVFLVQTAARGPFTIAAVACEAPPT